MIGGTLGFLSRKKKRKSPAKKRTAPSTPPPSKPAAKKTEAKKPSEPKKRVVKREPSKPAPKRRRTRKATGESKPESKATPTPQKRKPSPKKAEPKKAEPKKSEPKKVGGKPTKYTAVRKAVKLIAKEEGKEVTYAKGEFLSGLYEYEKGGKLSDTHRYIKRADIVKVVLDDGTEVTNPANGYWVKK